MKFWTVQNQRVIDTLHDEGIYVPSGVHCFARRGDPSDYASRAAYDWIACKLSEKIAARRSSGTLSVSTKKLLAIHDVPLIGWRIDQRDGALVLIDEHEDTLCAERCVDPVWLWRKYPGRSDGKPDMRSWMTDDPEHVARICVDIPGDMVLATDFDAWHAPLNGWFCSSSDEEFVEHDELLDDTLRAFGCSDRFVVSSFAPIFVVEGERRRDCDISCSNVNDGAANYQFDSSMCWFSGGHVCTINDAVRDAIVGLRERIVESWDNCIVTLYDDGSVDNNWKTFWNNRDDNDEKTRWLESSIQCVSPVLLESNVVSAKQFVTRGRKHC